MIRYRKPAKWNAEEGKYSRPLTLNGYSKQEFGNKHNVHSRGVIDPSSPVVFGQLDLFLDSKSWEVGR